MRKIKEVRLQNFQSHVDSTITFDDYNIIHGSTNAGKSSIIRGIRWALYNVTPAEGAEIRRFGTKETVVTITFDDNRKIVRRRTNKDNEYILIDENGNEQHFTQFGRGAVKEVQDFHGMYQVNLFGEPQSINIVDQDEPPFFLSQGPTARGHLISRLAGTLLYESALVLMRRDSSALMRHVDEKRKSLEEKETAIKELSYVDDLGAFIHTADERLMAADQIRQKNQTIAHQVEQMKLQRQQYLDNQSASSIADEVNDAQVRIVDAQVAMSNNAMLRNNITICKDSLANWRQASALPFTCEELENVLSRAQVASGAMDDASLASRAHSNLCEMRANIKGFENVWSLCDAYRLRIEERMESIEEHLQFIQNVSQQLAQIRFTESVIDTQESRIKEAESAIEALSKQYSDTLLELGLCPTCHQPIHQHEAEQAACVL